MLQPTLEALASQGLLVGLGVPDRMPELHAGLEQAARQLEVPFVSVGRVDIEDQLARWLEAADPDVVCVMGFPHKIPAPLLARPRLGFFNLHGGALPRYRGPDPVFWQIRNRERRGAVTIHRITEALDAGGIAHTETVPIGPEDTYGLHMQRLGALLPRVTIEFVQRLAIDGNDLPLTEQAAADALYRPRPAEADLTIDWNAPAEAIDALVRACNPIHGGAL
ncbi:MAG TPA: formyltransferase family protein, partial [Gammaproteobacteria bacterium]|nr:formyltransferase family protein [Gammaproteobacteria bacterium]